MSLNDRIGALAGRDVAQTRAMSGGDVSNVMAVTFDDGSEAVAKADPGAGREARMLAAIAGTGCPVARVIAHEDDLMILERLPEGRAGDAGWGEAGEAVAWLHAATGPSYGWDEDHAVGGAPIPQPRMDDWAAFWAEHRVLAWPEVLPGDIARRLERLAGRLPDLVPSDPPASLLHGDLWTGNLLFGPGGFAGLIDPASYHGDGEVDLSALTTFGRPPESFWEGYGPLRDGFDDRQPIYRLWIALLHLRLFGGSYRRMVERCLDGAGV